MRIFGATDIGTKRHSNQDAYINTALSKNAVLSVVCDGMGGANAGNIASSIAVNCITEYIKRSFVPALQPTSVKNLLLSAIDSANSEVFEKAQGEAELNGMGTTVVVALIMGETAYIAHVGDSRAYLIKDGSAQQLTRDHSVVQTLVETGHLTADEARVHPERNVITRALGVEETVEGDYAEIPFKEGVIVLCTDGMSNVITADDLANTANETALEELPKALINIANTRDSGDNVTVTAVTLD